MREPDFGAGLRRARRAAHLTQEELAARLAELGAPETQASVSRWENGGGCDVSLVPVIDEALGVRRGTVLVAAGYVEVDGVEAALLATDELAREEADVVLGVYRWQVERRRNLRDGAGRDR